MRLPRDILFNTYIKPRLFLCETDKSRICQLETTNTTAALKFNSYSELSFDVARVYNNLVTGEIKVNPFYDKIEAVRLIELEDFGYFELQGPELTSNGIEEKKACTAYSLEYTLSQKYLKDFYVNIGTVQSLEVINASSEKNIVPITLYNPDSPKLSLLHLVLSEIYGWRIGHVDSSLQTLSRQFEVDRESVYDFLMNEVCEKFNCYIVFDTINNTINVYAESLTAKFIGDGHSNSFIITPPFSQVGTVSIDGYKTTRWTYNSATGSVKLEDIPAAGARIEIVDGALTEWETDVFVTFDNLSQEININYDADAIKTRLTVTYGDDYDIREVNLGLPYLTDLSFYYTIDWMGQDLYDAYTKYLQKSNACQSEYANNSQEILKINDRIAYEENRLSLEYSLVSSVNSQTVGTYYIRQENADGSYYYSEVSLPSEYVADTDYYSNVTTNVNEEKVSSLYEVLKKYFYAYFNDNTDGITDSLKELNELSGFDFVDVYTLTDLCDTLKSTNTLTKIVFAIRRFLNELWVELGRTPLKELYLEPYKKIQEVNIQAGWSNQNSENYGYYYPVTLFIESIEVEIGQRDKTIGTYQQERSVYENANKSIGDSLLMRNNFTEGQLIRLSAFLREDELHLDNIVETSQDNLSSSFKVKQDAMESGRIELQKLCQPQLQFSMTMANIYALPEFEPIIHQFQLGKVIKVCLRPDYIKQSRLLQVNINFDDFSDFSCEFGELTSLRTQSDIHADLLSQAISAGKSVATNSSYWTRGSDMATSTDLKIQQGLLDGTTQIKAIDGTQGVVIDKYGIKLQKKLDNGELDPKQTWLVNNMILMSDDGFKTSRSALGEVNVDGESYYGFISEIMLSGYIEGSKIKGGTIQIGEYIDENGDTQYTFEVDETGSVTMNSVSGINGYVKNGDVISAINQSAEEIKIDASKITLEGHITANKTFEISTEGSMKATGGDIGGWEIKEWGIAKTATVDGISRTIGLQNPSVGAIAFTAGATNASDWSTAPFYVTHSGDVHASSGNIGGWDIDANTIQKTVLMSDNIYRTTGLQVPSSGTWAIAVGATNKNEWYTAPFRVDHYGNMHATSGSVGGWTISPGGLGNTANASTGTGSGIWLQATPNSNEYFINCVNYGNSSKYFRVAADGTIKASGATISGSITATSGKIGGWNLVPYYWGASLLYTKEDTANGGKVTVGTGMAGAADNSFGSTSFPAFWAGYTGGYSHPYAAGDAGAEWIAYTPFYVTHGGYLHATNAHIEGNITASGGTIGGCSITGGVLQIANANIGSLSVSKVTAGTNNNAVTFTNITVANGGKIGNWNIKDGNIWGSSDAYLTVDAVFAANNGMAPYKATWYEIATKCGAPTSSDIRLKNNITYFDNIICYDEFFDSLSPCAFKFNDEIELDDKTHFGFIAQDIIKSSESYLSEKQLSATWIDQDGYYKLNKEEFIALNTWQIQKLKARVAELEEKISKM